MATRFSIRFDFRFTNIGYYYYRPLFGGKESMRKREFDQDSSAAAGKTVMKNSRFKFSRQEQHWAMTATGWCGQGGIDVSNLLLPAIVSGERTTAATP